MGTLVLLEGAILFLLTYSYNVWGELPAPTNVTLDTLNTHYVLRWDWDREHAGNQNVTFTAQYLAKYKLRRPRQDWVTVCVSVSVSERECDFTTADLNYLGIFVLRVQASAQTHTHTGTHTLQSSWVNYSFCPDSDAALGPPSHVELSGQGRGLLEVKISDPVTHSNESMRLHVPSMYYRIQYWRQDTHTQAELVNSDPALVTLSGLLEWVVYCVRVQTRYDFYRKYSAYTAPQCIRTQGQTPYWQVALWFLLSLGVVFAVVLLSAFSFLRFFGVLKSTYFPSNQLPIHIQEYLQDAASDRPRLLTPESDSELLIGQLDICPEVAVAPATGVLEMQSELEYAHHDRHGSGDSGMYSAEEASGGGVALQETEKHKGRGEREGERKNEEAEEEEDEGVRDVCV
ncbi:interferon alpha/beta receptor 1b-like [Clupea harengus]|uniref:Interferon alpha/beta receptor 1b-like n=1 Tax=Clupea harengus TaxID=7950 RepID=A0A6P8GLT3_CLUHA|nr:interferon alpha/beta receptor 1b-like [Clupea harengus]